MKNSVILFGVGKLGKKVYPIINCKNEVLFFVDNNALLQGTRIFGKEVKSPQVLSEYPKTDVYISMARYDSVVEQLQSMGIKNIYVVVPYYDKDSAEGKCKLTKLDNVRSIDFFKYGKQLKINNTENVVHNNANRKVLFIAGEYPPTNSIGAFRPYMFVKYLKKLGYESTVVTRGYVDWQNNVDFSLLDNMGDNTIIQVQEKPLLKEELLDGDIQRILSLLSDAVGSITWMDSFADFFIEKYRLLPEDDIIWVNTCIKELNNRIDILDYSTVITTSGPYSSHLLGYYLKKEYGIKWIMDYRDPWCLNKYGMKRFYSYRKDSWKLEKELEISLLKKTDYVISAAEALEYDYRKHNSDLRYSTITNGYDEDDFNELEYKQIEKFRIVFNGSLYKDMNPITLIEVINEMIMDNYLVAEKVEIVFNGRGHNYIDYLKKYDKYNILHFNGYLSHRESLEICMNASILLVFGGYEEGAYYIYTGKIFEYLRTGVPILSFSSPYGLHYEMIEKRGRGITATYEDKDKIKNFIYKHYNDWIENGQTTRYAIDDYVRSFSRECLTGKLAEVLEEVR